MKQLRGPRDPNQLVKLIVDMATGQVPRNLEPPVIPATETWRKGGVKSGKGWAKMLSGVCNLPSQACCDIAMAEERWTAIDVVMLGGWTQRQFHPTTRREQGSWK